MRLFISVTSTDDVNTTKTIHLSADYNFEQLGEIIREMADRVSPTSKEAKAEAEGESRMETERGN